MKTKLTLTVEDEVVANVKRFAKRKGVSVSSLFEQWSFRMASTENRPPLGSRLRGQWTRGSSAEEDIRLDFLLDKHGK